MTNDEDIKRVLRDARNAAIDKATTQELYLGILFKFQPLLVNVNQRRLILNYLNT